MNTNSQTDDKKSKLSDEQKQKMKKYAVFALMFIIFGGCIWLIFSPPADKKAASEAAAGFNSEIPMPREEGIVGDKRDAYEKEQMQQKQAEKMRSLQDFSALLGGESKKPADDPVLLDEEPTSPKTGSNSGYALSSRSQSTIQTSAGAYRDINRHLGSFYETPKQDFEKERLKQDLEELRARMDESESRKKTVDEQMALMEKSFQMASKYIPMNAGTTNGTTEPATANASTNTSEKTLVVPVSQVVEQTVSALPQEMSGMDVMQALAQPRNMGFFTATAETSRERKNTISACIHADQTLMDGESVRLRLLEPVRAGKTFIRENTILSGLAKIQGERLQVSVYSLEYNGNIIPVEMAVYDTDGQRGIFIPDTGEVNAAREIAANMGTGAGTSISLSSDAGEQFAADMGRSVIQGVSQFFSKKMREVKVHLKAGYRVYLLSEEQMKNNVLANNQ
ncbi:MAG: conjugative transposon protein TraM [Bacteroidales bacterium]|jgi:conjugative transposon TraM protein|nr:conjugative transposon protein TraM [Bacteroidales bacterium]